MSRLFAAASWLAGDLSDAIRRLKALEQRKVRIDQALGGPAEKKLVELAGELKETRKNLVRLESRLKELHDSEREPATLGPAGPVPPRELEPQRRRISLPGGKSRREREKAEIQERNDAALADYSRRHARWQQDLDQAPPVPPDTRQAMRPSSRAPAATSTRRPTAYRPPVRHPSRTGILQPPA